MNTYIKILKQLEEHANPLKDAQSAPIVISNESLLILGSVQRPKPILQFRCKTGKICANNMLETRNTNLNGGRRLDTSYIQVPKDISRLIRKEHHFDHMISLSLYLWNHQSAEQMNINKEIRNLSKCFRRLPLLSSLVFSCNHCYGILTVNTRSLFRSFRHLVSLSSLRIKFIKGRITNEDTQDLIFSLKHLVHLTVLDMDFSGCSEITYGSLSSLRDSIPLSTLILNMKCSSVIDANNELFFRSLKHIPYLSVLDLNLAGDEVSLKEIQGLFSTLKHLPLLSTLKLDFTGSKKITDEDIKLLADSLNDHKVAHGLNLNFSYCSKLTDEALKLLSKSIQHLSNMRALAFNFSECWKITDEGSEALFNCLEAFMFVDLNFSNCLKVSDRSVKKLLSSLKNPSYISALKLNFKLCYKISDKSIEELSISIKNLVYLSYLSLVFDIGPKITNIGAESMSITVEYLRSLNLSYTDLWFNDHKYEFVYRC